MTRRALLSAFALLAALGSAAIVVAGDDVQVGRIGPASGVLNNGRHLQPFGSLVAVGQFPTGGAVTPNGRWYWTVSAGRGQNDVRIVSVRTRRVLQTHVLPGASGGIVMDPTKPVVYVAGVGGSEHADQKVADDAPGAKGNVIHVFRYRPGTGSAEFTSTIDIPVPSGAPPIQTFPPGAPKRNGWPDRLAISPDGKRLLVPLNLADHAAIVDVETKKVTSVKVGHYPYGAAILPDGKTGLVSNETDGTVSVIDLDAARKVKDITVGPHLSHPEAIVADPKADRAYVAVTNSDQVAVIDTKRMVVSNTLAVGREEGLGASPVALALSPDARRLYVAEAGLDAIAVIALPGSIGKTPAFGTIGRIPTAQYPTDVQVTGNRANPCGNRVGPRRGKRAKRCPKLLYVTGKGLGTGPNPAGPQPTSPNDTDDRINETQYLPLLNVGAAGIGDLPSDARLARLDVVAEAQVHPIDPQTPPADTPLRANGPIKHVFYVVRENRTYDQILGDEPRGDGDPKLALFGGDNTVNVHALVQRFPLIDHMYSNSEASIDGHFWTAAATVTDYVNKAWFPNYGGRDRPYDFGVYAVTWPLNGFIFDEAERQNVTYYNYGEAISHAVPFRAGGAGAGTAPVADKDVTPEETAAGDRQLANSDLGAGAAGNTTLGNQCYANDASVGKDAVVGFALEQGKLNAQDAELYDTSKPPRAKPLAQSRFDCFRTHFIQQLATGTVPALNYLVATNDHTQGLTAGARTPRAMIADNDEFVGRVVDLISHSPIWDQSAIFVIEDDSQDGADHVDAHRMPALVISPYAKRGAVIHTRYDTVSVVRSVGLILGLRPLSLFDALATPMYDAFQGTPANIEPFVYRPAKVPLVEYNPAGTPGARASARLPTCLDCIPQRQLDALLWKSVHGWRSVPPPPGPNAEGKDEAEQEEAEREREQAERSHTRDR